MKKGTLSIVLVVVIIVSALLYFYSSQNSSQEPTSPDQDGTTTGMRAEDNMIAVLDQKPGNTVFVSQVYLANPSYVVILDASENIVGSSTLLQAGEQSNITISLSRATQEGEKMNAVLYKEMSNTSFDASSDELVQSKLGGPIIGMFTVSSQAEGNAPISL